MAEGYRILDNANLATMIAVKNGVFGGNDDSRYGLIRDGAVVVHGERIVWVGKSNAVPAKYRASGIVENLAGRLVTPSLIDCHTHVVFGGDRAGEFERRLLGDSYSDIAKGGGGIRSTVKMTRQVSKQILLKSALHRVDRLIAEGIGVIEIKSGYGLNSAGEIKMLEVAREIAILRPVTIMTSFLGAHTVPDEWSNGDDYIDYLCRQMLPEIAAKGLIDAVDGFCETIAFSPGQIDRLFKCARELGLPVKLHAEQLSNLGGAIIAAKHNALSADHLEYLDNQGVLAMAEAGTVAVLLPGAFYALNETKLPPVRQLRQAGVAIALATDCNPGSSPMTSLLTAMNMGCTLFGLTTHEALAGVTVNAAKALGINQDYGTITPGKLANLAIWDGFNPAELCYWIGNNLLKKLIFKGKDVN